MARRTVSIGYKIFAICSIATGIVLNVMNTKSVSAMMSYYTMQSNVICLICFVFATILEICNVSKSDAYYVFKGAVIVAIIVTAIVYRVALAPVGFQMDALQNSVSRKVVANFFVHTLSPILVIGDYILFDEKGKFKIYYPFLWTCIPVAYVFYVYLYSYFGGRFYNIGGSRKFAYFFLDYEQLGSMKVLAWILLIATAILGIGHVIFFIDNRWGKNKC